MNRTRARFAALAAALLLGMLSVPAAQAEDPAPPPPVSGICHDSNGHFVPCVPTGVCQDEDGTYLPACISDKPPCIESVGEPCVDEWYIVLPPDRTAELRRLNAQVDRLKQTVGWQQSTINRQQHRIDRQAKLIKRLRARLAHR